ncbi:putative udp-glucose dehydrogenase udp-mannac protein [Neofusicoccum parvum]|nr:putative udp-glucose dehydrogenase udp-mannac protein [Neofusicoccum parvum]
MLPQVAMPDGEAAPCGRLQDSVTVWNSLGPSNADTPPPEEVNEEFFHASQLAPLEPVSDSEPPLVAVIGVGYVGLHLVTVFASKYDVLAYDVSKKRLQSLAGDLAPYPSITLTSNPADLAAATHFLVSVPTTLLPDKQIDTSYVRSALTTVGTYARPGATVVIESSVGVGMTRKLLGNLMRSRNLKAGMSPERVDPGRTEPPVRSIPKLISGLDDITPDSLAAIRTLYSRVFDAVVAVSSPEVAEMTKLYENCQRMVGIAYANEMADACDALAIDAFEVARAAATKPFGFLPFAPSLGVGGHCIPVNPYYLLANNKFPLLQQATERMWSRPARVADRAMRELRARGGAAGGGWPRVLVVGVGFKPGQAVLSCSPGVALIKHLLEEWDVDVAFADPLVDEEALPFVPKYNTEGEWSKQALEAFDLIVVAVRQHGLDFRVLEGLEGVEVKWCCA